jgi:hypothetical protein
MFQLGNLIKAKQFLQASKKALLPLAGNFNIY